MSIRILGGFKDHKHGIRDEMESLYYAFFYSGIRWLPHNQVANLGDEMDQYFYDRKSTGIETRGGAEKNLNVTSGRFQNSFKWEDKGTRLWMRHAWQLQNYHSKGMKKSWTPKRFMQVWTDALSLDPSKTDKCEHKILIRGRSVTSVPEPATNLVSCGVSQISRVMSGSLVLSRSKNMPTSDSKKRSLQQSQKEDKESNGNDGPASVVTGGSGSSYSRKKLRSEVDNSNGPILDPDENPFISFL